MKFTDCRMCHGDNLAEVLDLGLMPPADQFLRADQLHEPITHYPLVLAVCTDCGLVQLSYTVDPAVLYQQEYPYEASTTRTGREHWHEFARTTVERLGLGSEDLVVDIGSNVGVLLEGFQRNGTRILGVDPAGNIVELARARGIETLNRFFSSEVAREVVELQGEATVITGTNVFAHVHDLVDFMDGIDRLLNDRGTFIFEAPYLASLIENMEYDTIYHEHLSYLSVTPLVRFLERRGMEIFDIQLRRIHGGSFRVFVARSGTRPVEPIVSELVDRERETGLHTLESLGEFAAAVRRNRQELRWLLESLKHEGKRIVGVSAPAKGMTLLNYCGIGRETLDFITEKSRLKTGRFTPGAHIPVVPDEELLKQSPDYALLLAWNFGAEIMENLKAYTDGGGKFIVPIPRPHVAGG